VWSLSRSLAAGDDASEVEDDLFDEAVFEVAAGLRQLGRATAERGVVNMIGATNELTPQGQADLTSGRRSLDRYHLHHKQADLLAAQRHFRSLVARSPEYTDGLLMLSFALTENRQEREAIEVYTRLINEFRQEHPGPVVPGVTPRPLVEAQFLRASCRLKRYKWAEAIAAADEFLDFAAHLETATAAPPPAHNGKAAMDDYHYFRYMLARAYTETAHCHGHLIVLLPKDRPLTAEERDKLTKMTWRKDEVDKWINDQETAEHRRKLAGKFYQWTKEFVKQAAAIDPIYQKEWKADRASRLAEVSGYAQYRHAEWLPPGSGNDTAFRNECGMALRHLHQAELRSPRHYALLQNIGMIYLNRRCDPTGNELEQAEEFFSRSIDLKPGDYFGHQQLARVAIRRGIGAPNETTRAEAVAAGIDHIQEALRLRPESGSGRFLSLYLRLLGLPIEVADGKRKTAAESLLRDAEQADPQRLSHEMIWLRLACECIILQVSTPELRFTSERDRVKNLVDKLVADLTPAATNIWRENQLKVAAEQLATRLQATTFATRNDLRPDLVAAID
jgi:hypothetical protein